MHCTTCLLSYFQTKSSKINPTLKDAKKNFKNTYKIKETIGKGHFAKVYRGVCLKTGDIVAIKTLKLKYHEEHQERTKDSSFSEDPFLILEEEAAILKSLCLSEATESHKNIQTFYSSWKLPSSYFLVTEYLSGGNLCSKWNKSLKRYTEYHAKTIISQVLDATNYIHSKSIIHRDINHENVLFVNGEVGDLRVKLIDFGIATVMPSKEQTQERNEEVLGDSSLTSSIITSNSSNCSKECCETKTPSGPVLSFVGTPSYIAPEIIFCHDLHDHLIGYNQKVDIWSIGVLTYYLLSGLKPFVSDSERDHYQSKSTQNNGAYSLYEKIKYADFSFPNFKWHDKSFECKEFVREVLRKDPLKRLDAKEGMEHEWFQ